MTYSRSRPLQYLCGLQTDEAVRVCAMRRAMTTLGGRLRAALPRTVPWNLVAAVWKALGSGFRVHSGRPGGYTMAWVVPADKVRHMLRCLGSEDWQPDQFCAGEIWVRWGCDGAPLWSRNYLTLTVSLGALGVGKPVHSAHGYGCVAVLQSQETQDRFAALLDGCSLARAMEELEGKRIKHQGWSYRLRNFVLGDHMLQYKVSGAHGPTSPADWRTPCPYCDHTIF